jgi:hypothetical protein
MRCEEQQNVDSIPGVAFAFVDWPWKLVVLRQSFPSQSVNDIETRRSRIPVNDERMRNWIESRRFGGLDIVGR